MYYGIVQYMGSYGKEKCSYCNSKKETSENYGMFTFNISAQSYQSLMDRGWRRSGTYCYTRKKTDCCAFYTIRCDAIEFKLTKSKRKILKKMNKFLQSELIEQTICDMLKRTKPVQSMDYESELQITSQTGSKVDFNLNDITADDIKVKVEPNAGSQNNSIKSHQLVNGLRSSSTMMNIDKLKQSSKRKSKRILRRIDKLKTKHNCTDEESMSMMITNRKSNKIVNSIHSLEDYFSQENSLRHKLKIKIVPATPETGRVSYELFVKYQKIIHKDEEDKWGFNGFERFLISNPFFKNKKTPEWSVDGDSDLPNQYGCYHMQYWLDNRLIAVNVIDILPSCVSSVYFFYDPDYSFLNLGTYSSLREIELVRKLNKHNAKIKFYYMGFYIHSCIKMRYKGNIGPSYLLCPQSHQFYEFKWCNENFDLNKSNRFATDEHSVDRDGSIDVSNVLVYYKATAMLYQNYRAKSRSIEQKLKEQKIEEYLRLVGHDFVRENLYYIS